MQTRHVFICSAGHSGSTLLNLMLGAHPAGFALGEITQLPKNIALDSTCSCTAKISACRFWSPRIDSLGRLFGANLWQNPYELYLGFIKAGREIDRRHQTRWRMLQRKLTYAAAYYHLRRGIPLPGPLSRPLLRAADNKRRLFGALLADGPMEFLVDSSKHYLDGLHLYRAAPDRTRILLLIRDGRAVFHSGIRRGFPREAALSAWTSIYRRCLPVFDRHLPPESWLTVRYEDLAAAPEQELRRICRFLGLSFDPAMLDFTEAEHHVVNGNNMRFSADSRIRLDEKWRKELPEPMLDYFNRRASGLNRRLGYST